VTAGFQKKYLLLMCITGLFISVDQLTKLYVHTQFQLHESVPVIENFFSITYVRNFGAAFGILAEAPSFFRDYFFLMIPPVACATILYILRGVENTDTRQIVALSAIFSGALGNYLDRLQFRYVIDFIDFHYGRFSWPAFNVSDMAIVCGVIFLIYFMFQETRETPEPTA
jgi:signal peptidase II